MRHDYRDSKNVKRAPDPLSYVEAAAAVQHDPLFVVREVERKLAKQQRVVERRARYGPTGRPAKVVVKRLDDAEAA
jgi:hypothetical protein